MVAEQKVEQPFFIVGCARSGTSLLRNMLNLHPRLASPAETHLFRWAEPFGTTEYEKFYKKSKLFKQHRLEDGVTDWAFHYSLCKQPTRKGLMDWYGQEILRLNGKPGGRWFDKTPQNVYGLLLLSAAYPQAKFVHIVRNPLNVVVSLMKGEVLPPVELRGAINYWLESALLLSHYRQLAPDRLFEFRYEDLIEDPVAQLTGLLNALGEDPALFPFKKIAGPGLAKTKVRTKKLKDDYSKYLSAEQIEQIVLATEPFMSSYGYGI